MAEHGSVRVKSTLDLDHISETFHNDTCGSCRPQLREDVDELDVVTLVAGLGLPSRVWKCSE